MPSLNPDIILRDWDSRELVFKLPYVRVKTYNSLIDHAHRHAKKLTRDPGTHLHMQSSECAGCIDEESWNTGFYIRYLVRNLNTKARPNGEVEVFVHFTEEPEETSGILGPVVDYRDGGVPPWRVARPVGPKPGVRRRGGCEEGGVAGANVSGPYTHTQVSGVDSVEQERAVAVEAVRAAEEKVNKIKKRIEEYEEGEVMKLNWIKRRLERFDETGRERQDTKSQQPNRPARRGWYLQETPRPENGSLVSPQPAETNPGLALLDGIHNRAVSSDDALRQQNTSIPPPPNLSAPHPVESPTSIQVPRDSSRVKLQSDSPLHGLARTPVPDEVHAENPSETEQVAEIADNDAQLTSNNSYGSNTDSYQKPIHNQAPANSSSSTNDQPLIEHLPTSRAISPNPPPNSTSNLPPAITQSPFARYLNDLNTQNIKIKQEEGLTPEVRQPNPPWKYGSRVGEGQERVVIDLDSD